MPYVARNAQGRIMGVYDRPTPAAKELLRPDNPELRNFLKGAGARQAREKLLESDIEMARITEDLIDVLIAKNVINFTDFPEQAQRKLIARRRLRSNLSTLTNLVSDSDDII